MGSGYSSLLTNKILLCQTNNTLLSIHLLKGMTHMSTVEYWKGNTLCVSFVSIEQNQTKREFSSWTLFVNKVHWVSSLPKESNSYIKEKKRVNYKITFRRYYKFHVLSDLNTKGTKTVIDSVTRVLHDTLFVLTKETLSDSEVGGPWTLRDIWYGVLTEWRTPPCVLWNL